MEITREEYIAARELFLTSHKVDPNLVYRFYTMKFNTKLHIQLLEEEEFYKIVNEKMNLQVLIPNLFARMAKHFGLLSLRDKKGEIIKHF